MEKEHIINRFKENGFNDITIEYLIEAIEDCEKILGEYIRTEEIVDRVCNNLKYDIEFIERTDGNKGEYIYEQRKIILSNKMNDEKSKSAFFHEFLHCITTKEENGIIYSGFKETTKIEGKESVKGIGINEGIIQYLTNKRNNMRSVEEEKGYAVLVDEIKTIMDIVSEEEIVDCLFNEPEFLKNLLTEYNVSKKEGKENKVIEAFDSIYKETKECTSNRNLSQTKVEKEMDEIFFLCINSLEEVEDISAFEEKVSFCRKELDRRDHKKIYNIYNEIIKDVELLKEQGYDEEELKDLISKYGLEEGMEQVQNVNTLLKMDETEVAIKIYELYKKDLTQNDNTKEFSEFQNNFATVINKKLFHNREGIEEETDLLLTRIIGKYLKNNPDIDFNEVSIKEIEYINFFENNNNYRSKAYTIKTDYGEKAVILDIEEDIKKEKDGDIISITNQYDDEMIKTSFDLSEDDISAKVSVNGQKYLLSEIKKSQPSNLSIEKDKLNGIRERQRGYTFSPLLSSIFSKTPNEDSEKLDEESKKLEKEIKEMEEKISKRKTISCEILRDKDKELDEKIKDANKDRDKNDKKDNKKKSDHDDHGDN